MNCHQMLPLKQISISSSLVLGWEYA